MALKEIYKTVPLLIILSVGRVPVVLYTIVMVQFLIAHLLAIVLRGEEVAVQS